MPWHARLQLTYTRRSARTVAIHSHEGPLRILQTLYPEGDGIAHNVLVHPPSGIVGGDTLDIALHAQEGTHGPLGLAGRRCIAMLFFACGDAIDDARRERLLAIANDVIASSGAQVVAGATAPGPNVIVVRALAGLVEPAMHMLKKVHAAWR